MTSYTTPMIAPGEGSPPASPASVWLARGLTVAWWYTLSAVVFFECMLLLVLVGTLVASGIDPGSAVGLGSGGLIWIASTYPLLADYRNRADAPPGVRWARLLAPMLIAVALGVASGAVTGSWLFALFPLAQSLTLLNWQPGVRLRVVVGLTLALGCMWAVDSRMAFAVDAPLGDAQWWLPAFYMTFLPFMTVTSLWWWDVLAALDRARASEAKLAAAQERLRLATDVHDLQGHHLQVIALQLELAERLAPRDPETSLEQLRAARKSVDDAVQGTRDLALQFRSVPLRDELANAADLLRAAGLDVETAVDAQADRAPAPVLGPVIRETTTNVLRHGAGTRARLALTDAGNHWRYEIANDRVEGAPAHTAASGLEGVERRVSEAGGSLEIDRSGTEFTVVVTVPKRREESR